MNIDVTKVNDLDKFIQRPVSRSDIINDVLGYVLQSPQIIEHFVNEKLKELQSNADSVNNV